MSESLMPEYIAIGKIVKSVGIRGEVKILPLTDDPERFFTVSAVWVGAPAEPLKRHFIDSVRSDNKGVVLTLRGINDRTAADGQRNKFLFVPDSDSVAPRKGSYFIHDIIGMKVFTEENRELGVVEDVYQLPANDVWVVKRGRNEIFLPAINDVIKSIDVQEKVIVIRMVEGLIDED
ncbi:MAG: ribosome maturation factor RimM [bacterium]